MGTLEDKIDPALSAEYKERIMHQYDAAFLEKSIKFVEKKRRCLFGKNIPELLFSEIVVNGAENVWSAGDKQLIYVSNHTSMADFLIQSYVFWKEGMVFPRIIAGENLNKGRLGKWFKRWGAIYVDRNTPRSNRDYWRTYDRCINECFDRGESFLNYGEGTRTDGVEIASFKTGTFQEMLNFMDSSGKDLLIVPSYINYNKRIDSRFIDLARHYREKRDAARKEKKSLKAAVYDWAYYAADFSSFIHRVFSKDKGNAYLYFGEPFSVKEYLDRISKTGITGRQRKGYLARKSRDVA